MGCTNSWTSVEMFCAYLNQLNKIINLQEDPDQLVDMYGKLLKHILDLGYQDNALDTVSAYKKDPTSPIVVEFKKDWELATIALEQSRISAQKTMITTSRKTRFDRLPGTEMDKAIVNAIDKYIEAAITVQPISVPPKLFRDLEETIPQVNENKETSVYSGASQEDFPLVNPELSILEVSSNRDDISFKNSGIKQDIISMNKGDKPETILRNLFMIYGLNLLQNEQRLCAMIADLFADDRKTKKMLHLSVKEKVPQQMIALKDSDDCEIKIKAIKQQLKEEVFLNDETAALILSFWLKLFELEDSDESFQLVGEKGNYVFKNSLGKNIPFKYDFADSFSEGLARVALFDKNGEEYGFPKYTERWGFIDKLGEEVIPLKYEHIDSFSEGLACTKLNGKYGFINKHGEEVIPFKYHSANSFKEGLAAVWLNGKCGFINKQGKEIIPLIYNFAYDFSENLAGVRSDHGGDFFIDKQGREISSLKYESIRPFSEGYAPVMRRNNKNEERWGFIDIHGNEIIPLKYENALPFSEGLACVLVYNNPVFCPNWGFIDKQGKLIISDKYKAATSFYNGFASVKPGDTWYCIDKKERAINSFEYYEDIGRFNEGLALVLCKGKMGYINMQGEEVISVKFEDANSFSEGLANVKLNGKWGFIDKQERRIFR